MFELLSLSDPASVKERTTSMCPCLARFHTLLGSAAWAVALKYIRNRSPRKNEAPFLHQASIQHSFNPETKPARLPEAPCPGLEVKSTIAQYPMFKHLPKHSKLCAKGALCLKCLNLSIQSFDCWRSSN